ncbi:MAG: zinc metallopeptidase [Rikenellaceae bacterium]|nr:zinc metallopeptidase [Rikenellaceae bacterium]
MSWEILLIIVIGIIGMVVQARLQSVFNKYSKVLFPRGLTGREVAERMLAENGITDVKVQPTNGNLTDNFNPTNKTISLSESVYNSNSIAAAAVAAHETGHAVQHARGYAPVKLRTAIVPFVSFSSRFAVWFVILGIILASSTGNLTLFWIGIGLIAASALFSLVTLPVELDASRRALAWLRDSQGLTGESYSQAKEALSWAARTYVVAALSAIATLIYYLGFARRN